MASSPVPANAVRAHLLDDTSSDQKARAAADDHEIQQNGGLEPPKLKRYWVRTLALILIPAIVTVWYGVIWVELVLRVDSDDAVKYRNSSGSLIFYSWFIIGVFGLSWAKYGLDGVEVAMLQTRFWRAPNLVAFLMHSNSTWSGLSGWLKAIYHRQFHRLWCLLSILSILPFIAFPLSGLVFELGDGYVATSKHPMVVGRNQTNFRDVYPMGKNTMAEMAWRTGATPIVPGFGVVYTPKGIDRSRYPGLTQIPNTLPLGEAIPDMFLAPQGEMPISGKAWGLRVKYDCSNVRSASEFTILSEKPQSTIKEATTIPGKPSFILETPSGNSINIFSSGVIPPNSVNVWSYGEIGTNNQPGAIGSGIVHYNESTPDFEPHDVSKSLILEYALWQIEFEGYYDKNLTEDELRFDRTLGTVIEGMASPYSFDGTNITMNDEFFKIRGDGDEFFVSDDEDSPGTLVDDEKITDLRDLYDAEALVNHHNNKLPAKEVARPVGVRCIVSSGLGTAQLDGTSSTFSDFERVDPDIPKVQNGHSIFGHTAFNSLRPSDPYDLYAASHSPPKLSATDMWRWQSYVSSQGLQEAVMLAYGLDALQLLYELYPGRTGSWENRDLTTAEEGRVLTIASLIPGTGVGYFVLVLFSIWAALSAALGIIYGFRKRPSDILSGYEAFGHGVELACDVRHNEEFKSRQSFYNNKTFRKLPGSQLHHRRT